MGCPEFRPERLPLGDQAVVKRHKTRDYLLNPDSPDGQHKARRFREVLGCTRIDWERLSTELERAAVTGTVVSCRPKSGGAATWQVVATISGPDDHQARVRINWEVRIPGAVPKLTTAWIDD